MSSPMKSHILPIAFLVLTGFVFLMMGNGAVALTHPDEVFYVQTAKEMIRHHSWATPYIFDAPQFEKPVFFYWLLIGAFKLFGITPFTARFWPAFFGISGLLLTYAMSWLMFRCRRTALFAGLVLSTSFIYIALSRAVLTDMVFSVWVLAALTVFFWGYLHNGKKDLSLILFTVICAAAVMTKGLLGLCFPLGTVFFFLLARSDLKYLRCRTAFLALVLFAVLAAPWHALMVKKYGTKFISEYFFNVHFRRLWDAEHDKCNTWYFYPGVLTGGIFPWTVFLFGAVRSFWRRLISQGREDPSLLFLLVWTATVFAFVQPAHSKLASYIFPAFPALAILLGRYFAGCVWDKAARPGFRISSAVTSVLFAAIGVGVLIAARIYSDFVPDPFPVRVFSGLMFLCAGGVLISAWRGSVRGVVAFVMGVPVALLAVLPMSRIYAEPWLSCREICGIFERIDRSDSTVLASKFYVRGVRFFTDRDMAVIDICGKKFFSPHPIPFLNNDEITLDFLARQPVTYGIVKKPGVVDLERICRKGGYELEVLEHRGGKYIVRIQPRKSEK